jgi:microcystin-dependent protein
MAAINFPTSPSNGDTYTENGATYEYESSTTAWLKVPATWINDGAYVYYNGALNVGIGTNTPSTKLHVVGTTLLAGETDVTGDFAVNTDVLWVNASNGRVGIGTISPSTNLHVVGTSLLAGATDITGILTVETNGGTFATNATVATAVQAIQGTTAPVMMIADSVPVGVAYSLTASTELAIVRDNDVGLSLITSATGNSKINFGDTDQEDKGRIQYDHATDRLEFSIAGATSITFDDNKRIGVNTTTPAVTLDLQTTDAIQLPVGTTAQRPTDVAGRLRYNSTLGSFEGYTTEWGAIGGAGGGGLEWILKTTTYTSSSTEAIIANTSGGAWTLTLPASPSTGDYIQLLDGADWAANNLTVARNGQTIEGDASDLVMDISGVAVDLVFDGTTWQVTAQVGGQGGSFSGTPTGSVLYFATSTPPDGWLECNGQAVTSVFPDLRALLIGAGSPYGSDGTGPYVPDLRGEFVRGWDNSRGIDAGRVFGSAQSDELKSHSHTIETNTNNFVGDRVATFTSNQGATLNTGAFGGAETRPRNIALLACIKAASTVDTAGMADLSELLTSIATQSEAETGTDNTKLMTPLRSAQAIAALTPPAGPTFEGDVAYTTTSSVSHGLGRVPTSYQVVLRCVNAVGGYSVGDETDITSQVDGDGSRNYMTTVNSTTMYIRRDTTNMTDNTPNWANLGTTNWRVVFKAW